MRWHVLLTLIACNAIWATNPLMGKILLRDHAALQVSWMRYGFALVAAWVALLLFRWRAPGRLTPLRDLPSNLPWILVMGLCTFFGSAVLQYAGLARSTSTANALLVATEPLFAAFLAWAFLREALHWKQFMAFACALSGFLLLSHFRPGDWGSLALLSLGNVLLLLTMPMEAMYSVISRKVAGRVQAVPLFTLALMFGFSALSLYLAASGLGFPSLSSLGPKSWLALLWLGPLGTTATYMYWSVALVDAPVAPVSLTLFAQPLIGTALGALLLEERLTLWQGAGALLILSALALQTTHTLRRNP